MENGLQDAESENCSMSSDTVKSHVCCSVNDKHKAKCNNSINERDREKNTSVYMPKYLCPKLYECNNISTETTKEPKEMNLSTVQLSLITTLKQITVNELIEFEWNGNYEAIKIDDRLQIVNMNDAEYSEVLSSIENSLTKNGKRRMRDKGIRKKISLPDTFIPKPEFKKLEITYRRKMVPPKLVDYIEYIHPTLEEKNKSIEYEMDEEDFMWLDEINKLRLSENYSPVSEDIFEFIMDRFEKNSYFENVSYAASIDEDALCSVCLDGDCHNSNAIIFCDRCNLPVHQECYGVPYIPEGEWICRRCMYSPSYPVSCALCPSKSGAFKQTTDNRWAHVVCALFIPEVRFMNAVFLEPIADIDKIPFDRWKLDCYICHMRGAGACIQCEKSNCFTAFHVTCAQQAGLFMKSELDDSRSLNESSSQRENVFVKRVVYCEHHTPIDSLSPSILDNKSIDFSNALKHAQQARMLKYHKNLSETERGVPSISLPVINGDKLHLIKNDVVLDDKENFFSRIHNFWRLRRYHRNGVPLIRRLQYEVKLFTKKCEMMSNHKKNNSDSNFVQSGLIDSNTKTDKSLHHRDNDYTQPTEFNERDFTSDLHCIVHPVDDDITKCNDKNRKNNNDTSETSIVPVAIDKGFCSYLRFVRQGMERVRLLTELVRKREKIKHLLHDIELGIVDRKKHVLKAVLEGAVEEMIIIDYDKVFLHPVDKDTLYYYAVIAHPICLNDIKEKVHKLLYISFEEFSSDAFTICKNCFTYNISRSSIYRYGKKFQKLITPIIRRAEKKYTALASMSFENSPADIKLPAVTTSEMTSTLIPNSSVGEASSKNDGDFNTTANKAILDNKLKVRAKRRRKWKREFVMKRYKRKTKPSSELKLSSVKKIESCQQKCVIEQPSVSKINTSSESYDSPSDENASGVMLRSHFR